MMNYAGKLISNDGAQVAGILNVTLDSFFDGGQYFLDSQIAKRVEQIIDEGANMIDVGAYSTRPGACVVPSDEELACLRRALTIVRQIAPDALVSIDTFRANVVRSLFDEFGCFVVNDISAGTFDDDMFRTVAQLHLPYVLMHLKGDYHTMHNKYEYDNLMVDVVRFLSQKLSELRLLGVSDVLIDPGFGFSKNVAQNYQLLSHLSDLQVFNLPLYIGLSRKSMIYRPLEITPSEALVGTAALNMVALQNGASWLRVHDVKDAVQVVKLYNLLNS